MKERTLTAEREAIPEVIAFLDAELDALGCPRRAKMQINIAADELYSNIANYAYAGEKGPVTVGIEPLQDPPSVRISFRDRGMPFNPLERRDPDLHHPSDAAGPNEEPSGSAEAADERDREVQRER